MALKFKPIKALAETILTREEANSEFWPVTCNEPYCLYLNGKKSFLIQAFLFFFNFKIFFDFMEFLRSSDNCHLFSAPFQQIIFLASATLLLYSACEANVKYFYLYRVWDTIGEGLWTTKKIWTKKETLGTETLQILKLQQKQQQLDF